MSKEYFYSRNICCSEITEHPDHYLAKFVICDFLSKWKSGCFEP